MSEKSAPLSEARLKIDAIDTQILDLLQQRNQVSKEILETKIKNKLPIFVSKREEEKVQDFRAKAAQRGLNEDWAEDFLRMIMSSSRASQSTTTFPSSTASAKTILIIGGKGGMGKLYARFFESSGHQVRILDVDNQHELSTLASGADVAIVTVPIHVTAQVIEQIAPYLDAHCVLADFTSNKLGLPKLMAKVHKGPVVSLHPMHGPDVENLSKQLMLISPIREESAFTWLIEQFDLWGMRVKQVDPVKHDHAMDLIQGLRHFLALLHGSFMRLYDMKPEDIVDFSSPIYRAELMMTGRIFAQDAQLYADIVMANEERRKLMVHFHLHHAKLTEMILNYDKEGFIKEFEQISTFFGNFADQALKESGYLINRLADRFAN